MVPKEFPSPRGVGADLTVREGKHAVDGRVPVPSRGWGRSHTTCRSRFPARASSGSRPLAGLGQISQGVPHRVADDGRPGFRPLAGLGQISHYIRQYKHFADEFPSPRGVGADLRTREEQRWSTWWRCFRPLAGLGQISPWSGCATSRRGSCFRPLAGLGQISLDEARGRHYEELGFPSPRGVGADLAHPSPVTVKQKSVGFPSPRGVGAPRLHHLPAIVRQEVSVPSRGWGRSHTAMRFILMSM